MDRDGLKPLHNNFEFKIHYIFWNKNSQINSKKLLNFIIFVSAKIEKFWMRI
jgi:hypothetical protein